MLCLIDLYRNGAVSDAESEFSKDLLMTGLTSVDAIVTSFLDAKADPGEEEGEPNHERVASSRFSLVSSQRSTQSTERKCVSAADIQEVHQLSVDIPEVHKLPVDLPEVHQLIHPRLGHPENGSASSMAFLQDLRACGSQYLAKTSKSAAHSKGESQYLTKSSKSPAPPNGESHYLVKTPDERSPCLGKKSKSTSTPDEGSSSTPSSPFLSAPSSRLLSSPTSSTPSTMLI